MKIDSSIPSIDPTVSSLKDSIQSHKENRQVVQAGRAVNASGKLVVETMSIITYEQNRSLSASPLELVQILYTAAVRAVESAQNSMNAGDIASRSREIKIGR